MSLTVPPIRSRGATFDLVRQDVVESLMTGGEAVAPQGVALWHYTFPLVPQTYAEAQEWMGVLARLTKMGQRFIAGPPGFSPPEYVKKYWTGSAWTTGTSLLGQPLMDGINQSGETVQIKNLVAGETFLQRGDYISFENPLHGEIKVVTADCESDGAGKATLEFTPPLRTPNSGEDVINIVEPVTLFRLKSPQFFYNLQPNRIVNMTIEAVESYGFDT